MPPKTNGPTVKQLQVIDSSFARSYSNQDYLCCRESTAKESDSQGKGRQILARIPCLI